MITNERNNDDLWYALACGLLLATAAAIRFRNLGTTLFEDEVWVSELVQRGGLRPHTFNAPPLFYWIERVWSSVRGFSDAALREPPAIFGVALCAIALAAPFPRLTRFVWAVLLAFSSPLIFYSEHLKQYTLEGCFVAALIVLFLRLRESPKAWVVAAFFAVSAIAVLTLHSPIFLLAAMAVISIRQPRMLAGFAIVFALWGVAYFGWLAPGPETVRLHGDMTEFFTATGRWVTSPSLFVTGTMHWMGQSLNLVRFWWLAVGLLGLVWIIRERNIVVLLLAILPPIEVAAASAFHIYPYGEVRLMIFCFPSLFLLIAASLAAAARRIPLLLLLVVPVVFVGASGDTYNRTYMHIEDLRELYATVVNAHRAGEPIFSNPSYAGALRHYYPSLGADLRPGVVNAPSNPGWYVQRSRDFAPAGAGIVVRTGDVIAARVGEMSAAPAALRQ
ncbi:MAG: hypothetical protein QOK37_2025 [Thermoanaerobaculia bacterium]|nr:hypothetical protein [Thermoanaerobaculia bacterium]